MTQGIKTFVSFISDVSDMLAGEFVHSTKASRELKNEVFTDDGASYGIDKKNLKGDQVAIAKDIAVAYEEYKSEH